jgi:hypothetical protein
MVYAVTIPNAQSTNRMTNIVQSMFFVFLRRLSDAGVGPNENCSEWRHVPQFAFLI